MSTSITVVNGTNTTLNATIAGKSSLNITPGSKTVIQPAIFGIKGQDGVSNIISIEEFTFVSFDGQEEIDFPANALYTPGKNALFIYADGIYIDKSQYIEVDSSKVKFITPLADNKLISVKYIQYSDFNNGPSASSGVVVSALEPTNNLANGMLWFNPLDASFSVYSSVKGFQTFVYRQDFTQSGFSVQMDGGSF